MPVRVQTHDFDLTTEIAQLRADTPKVGAVVTFVGTVRDLNEGEHVAEMELEHYPGMRSSFIASDHLSHWSKLSWWPLPRHIAVKRFSHANSSLIT